MTESEVALCDRLRDWAERLGFEVYPEVAGWDLVLVASRPIELGRNGQEVAAGEQVGVHAKLRANCDVLAQAVTDEFASSGPTWPMVGVTVAGGSFRYIAHRLGVGVIECPVPGPGPGVKSYVGTRVAVYPRRTAVKALVLPPVASRAIVAGAPSPRVLSPWRVKALRFLAFVRAAAETRFRASDVKTHGLSISWVERWGVPVDWATENRRGKPVRVRVYQLTDNAERLPDWGYLDVARELLEADRGA
jgi:hypothetical protein